MTQRTRTGSTLPQMKRYLISTWTTDAFCTTQEQQPLIHKSLVVSQWFVDLTLKESSVKFLEILPQVAELLGSNSDDDNSDDDDSENSDQSFRSDDPSNPDCE